MTIKSSEDPPTSLLLISYQN